MLANIDTNLGSLNH